MKQFLALVALCAAGCTSTAEPGYAANENLLATGFPGLPSDARLVAERLASCSHFAGEFNGDRSDRDKEVASTMADLRCDTIDQDVSAVRHKYVGDRAVQEALAAASEL